MAEKRKRSSLMVRTAQCEAEVSHNDIDQLRQCETLKTTARNIEKTFKQLPREIGRPYGGRHLVHLQAGQNRQKQKTLAGKDPKNQQWNILKSHVLLDEVLKKYKNCQDFELEHDFPWVGEKRFPVNGRGFALGDQDEEMILLAMEEQ